MLQISWSGCSALAEPKLLNGMMGKSNTSKEMPKIYLRGDARLNACSHVNKIHSNPNKMHTVESCFVSFFKSFPPAMRSCEIWALQGTYLCKTSAELVHPRSAVLSMGKIHEGPINFHLSSKYSRHEPKDFEDGA